MLLEEIKKHRYLILAIAVAGLFVYAFNLDGPLFWDDDDWIINNPFVHSFSSIGDLFTKDILGGIGLESNYYRPILLLTFVFNYVISGVKSFGYHLFSNLLHVANGVAIFLILNRVLRKRIAAFIAALLFTLHPLQVEAVAYISGRGDPLNVFFMLLATLFFMSNGKWYRIWSIAFAALAILSRETAVVFPVFLTIFYMSFLTKDAFWSSLKNALRKASPYFMVSVVYGILRLTILDFKNTLNFYDASNIYTENISIRILITHGERSSTRSISI
jgi:hypothetical protein